MTGYNMPPGCNSTPFDDEYVQPRCSKCGRFVKTKPDGTWEEVEGKEDRVTWSGTYVMCSCGKKIYEG
jgi:hypothetical protein